MLIRSLLICLALCSATASAYKPALAEGEAVSLFFDTGYTYCDARLLAQEWGLPMPYGAKVRTGRFLDLPRGRNRVSRFASDVRTEAAARGETCDFTEIGLDFSDIMLLSEVWGMETWDVKTRVTQEFMANRGRGVFDKLPARRMPDTGKFGGKTYAPPPPGPAPDREPGPLDDTRFTFCDAEKVALAWQTRVDEAVERLQVKAEIMTPADQIASMDAVRGLLPRHKCAYHRDFSYYDADVLASEWGADIMDVKASLGHKLDQGWATPYLVRFSGRPAYLEEQEYAAEDGTDLFVPAGQIAAFTAHGWTHCDAVQLASLWKSSPTEAKERAAMKLIATGPHADLAAYREDARRLSEVDGVQCDVSDDFSDADIATMAAYWQMSETEARDLALAKLNSGVNQSNLQTALGHASL